MTRSEKREERRLNREFRLKYGIKRKNKYGQKKIIPDSVRLNRWRKAVLKRDGYVCQQCGLAESLHVHHKQWKIDRPDLKYKVSNGITLCKHCHDNTHDGLVDYYQQQSWLKDIVGGNFVKT